MIKRTHTCGELRIKDVSKEAALSGWVHARRDHGGIIFIDLRDRYGITQLSFDPAVSKKAYELADKLRREDVIAAKGEVVKRKEGMENPKLKTGEIEIKAAELKVINKAKTPPIEIDDRIEPSEEIRLKYRYLDLRRPKVMKKLIMRHKIISLAREYFNKHSFIEITTPLLVKSTPEGARDYLVPSRVNPGKFYALPQSPQLYKQILMIAGFDKYYQIATCLRDEDLRQDRQPEHMQFDFEMSFVTSDDIREFVEGLYKHLFKEALGIKLESFKVFSYKEAMDRYGTDKPDIRYGLYLNNVSEIVKDSEFSVFRSVIEKGGIVKCINPEKSLSRKELDSYIDFCQKLGAKGMAWMRVTEEGLESNIVKYFSEDIQKKLIAATKAKPGSTLMFIADESKKCNFVLSRLRQKLAEDLKLYNEGSFAFCWVKDFPLFAWNEEEQRWEPEHHMFSMPLEDYVESFEKQPEKVIGDLWDLVLNGIELGSGSIRVSDPELQQRIMKFIGLSKEEAEEKFGFLLEAYNYGAPVHGGMGLGVDRTVAMMCNTNDIREVIAFPKNKAAQCPMDGSPGIVSERQLKELHIKLDIARKEKQ